MALTLNDVKDDVQFTMQAGQRMGNAIATQAGKQKHWAASPAGEVLVSIFQAQTCVWKMGRYIIWQGMSFRLVYHFLRKHLAQVHNDLPEHGSTKS